MAEIASSLERLDPKAKRQFWENHIQAWKQCGLVQAERGLKTG